MLSESGSEVAPSCLTLCDPMGCSLPRSTVHGLFQARVLEWAALSFSRGSSRPRDRTQVSRTAGRRFTVWASRGLLVLSVYQQLTHPGAANSVAYEASPRPLNKELRFNMWEPSGLQANIKEREALASRDGRDFGQVVTLWCHQDGGN